MNFTDNYGWGSLEPEHADICLRKITCKIRLAGRILTYFTNISCKIHVINDILPKTGVVLVCGHLLELPYKSRFVTEDRAPSTTPK